VSARTNLTIADLAVAAPLQFMEAGKLPLAGFAHVKA